MGVIARHRSMEDWSISLGNTLLASIVCLLWYVFGLWDEADIKVSEEAPLTSAERRSGALTRRRNSITGQTTCAHRGQEVRDTSTCCQRRADTSWPSRASRQEEIQSAMQLKEEKAPVAPEQKKT